MIECLSNKAFKKKKFKIRLSITLLSIYNIKDLIASKGPLIFRGINKRRLKRDKTE
jgi:hypothetical protein